MWHPMKYASMLADKMNQHGTTAWLVNTGWTGGRWVGQQHRDHASGQGPHIEQLGQGMALWKAQAFHLWWAAGQACADTAELSGAARG